MGTVKEESYGRLMLKVQIATENFRSALVEIEHLKDERREARVLAMEAFSRAQAERWGKKWGLPIEEVRSTSNADIKEW